MDSFFQRCGDGRTFSRGIDAFDPGHSQVVRRFALFTHLLVIRRPPFIRNAGCQYRMCIRPHSNGDAHVLCVKASLVVDVVGGLIFLSLMILHTFFPAIFNRAPQTIQCTPRTPTPQHFLDVVLSCAPVVVQAWR